MSQKTDLRIIKTTQNIREAFIALLTDVGFEKITIKMLCEQANINRATFYRHYVDKYELADKLLPIIFSEINGPTAEIMATNPLEAWRTLFEHVADYADFYRTMLGKNGIPGFAHRVQETVEKQMYDFLSSVNGQLETESRLPTHLSIRYLAAAQVGFIQWWIENDMPYPPAEAAQYLIQLHQNGGMWGLGLTPN